jgi:hypothetical protein
MISTTAVASAAATYAPRPATTPMAAAAHAPAAVVSP